MNRRVLLAIITSLTGLFVLLALLAILFPQMILTVESGPVKGEVMVVMGGFTTERPQRAAELFKAGAATKIILSGSGDGLVNQQLLKKIGVPENVIIVENQSTTTYENAQFSIPLLRQMGAHRVIVVTSWYHSRRALTTFKHLAPDLQFYSRPSFWGYESNSKQRQYVIRKVELEYPKLIYYWLWHGVPPF